MLAWIDEHLVSFRSFVDIDGNEFNETKKTYLEVPLNVSLLLCPTDSYKTYKYFDSKK